MLRVRNRWKTPSPSAGGCLAYRASWLRSDLVAGLTLAAYLLPAGIGDASLAGLAPEAGLYACLFSGLVFWFFCSSRHTVITVTSALSLLIGASVGDLSGGDPARHAALGRLHGAHGGVDCLRRVAGSRRQRRRLLLRDRPRRVQGRPRALPGEHAAPEAVRLQGHAWRFLGALGVTSSAHLGETHPTSLLVGVAALAVLVAGKIWLKNRPVAFFVVVAGIVAARLLDLEARGRGAARGGSAGAAVARTAAGQPARSERAAADGARRASCSAPSRRRPSAACSRQKHGDRFDANQEFLALGAANLVAGLGRGFPVSGGMSQSLVNESAGARTPLSGLVAALFTLDRRAVRVGTAAEPAAARAGGYRPGRGHGPRGHRRAASTSGTSAARSSSWPWWRCSACSAPGRSTACSSAPRSRSCCCFGRPRVRA